MLFISAVKIKAEDRQWMIWLSPPPPSLLGTSRRETWSWPRLCLAGCLRRPESWESELLPIIVSERQIPLLRTPSQTWWWVSSDRAAIKKELPLNKNEIRCSSSGWTGVSNYNISVKSLNWELFTCTWAEHVCETRPRRSTASSSRCCRRADGFPLTEMISSSSL